MIDNNGINLDDKVRAQEQTLCLAVGFCLFVAVAVIGMAIWSVLR